MVTDDKISYAQLGLLDWHHLDILAGFCGTLYDKSGQPQLILLELSYSWRLAENFCGQHKRKVACYDFLLTL